MPVGPDPYFRLREQQERDRAETSADPAVRAIHLDLAARYARLTRDARGAQPAQPHPLAV